MRGKNYNDGSRRLVGGGTLGITLVIIVLAVAMIFLLLLYLPLTDETNNAGIFGKGAETEWNKIVSISYDEQEIGVGSQKDKIYLTVTYDNGQKEDVALSQMVCAGLDVTSSGTQNVSLSYGGFEQTIPITVKDVDCVLTYSASDGGRIQGEKKQSIVSGHDGSTVVAVPETGYTFVEWNDGYPYATRKDKSVNETREYKAIFEKTQFVVFFFYDDGTVAREESVLYGEAATDIPKMSDPRMSVYGKTFQGWSVNEEDYKCVVRNMNIYPQYVKTATDVNLTVSSDQYGSHMGITNVNECGYYEHNTTGMITATPYNSREFDCWEVWGYATPTSETAEWIKVAKKLEIGESTERIYIGDNKEVCVFTSNSTGNAGTEYTLTFTPNEYMDYINLRANFVYSNSTVTFINYQNSVKNNQECVIADIPYGTTIGEALAETYLTEDGAGLKSDSVGMLLPADVYGYSFIGWYDKLDEEQKIITVNKIFTEPTSLIAKWEKLKYNVVFDYSTADNFDNAYSIEVYFQSTIGSGGGVPTIQPYAEKYDFLGWEDVLTHELIDDSTQIIAKADYLSANNDFLEGNIYMKPRWAPKEHTLKVDSTGSGSVFLRVHPSVGAAYEDTISGTYTIYETYTYELLLRADIGYYVSSYTVKFANEIPRVQTSTSSSVSPIVNPQGDSYYAVTFEPIIFTATIYNGNALYRGYIENVSGGDSDTVLVSFTYGSTFSANIVSNNVSYEIAEIRVSGKVAGVNYSDEIVGGGLEGSKTMQYTLVLENCTSDLTITIRYGSINYAVNVRQPENARIGTTVYNGSASDYNDAPDQRYYSPGDRLFYDISATGDNFISEVRLSGIRYDVFSPVSTDNGMSVVFYDWYISGESYGVTLKIIDGEYYYSFGTAEYDGVTYLYCQDVFDSSLVTIFRIVDADNERYEAIDGGGASNAPSDYYSALCQYLEKTLHVAEKGIGNPSMKKDNRVTSVKLMVVLSGDVNISVFTDLLYYVVSVKANDLAVSTVTSSSVAPGSLVTVKTKPITGYDLKGYYLNGSEEMTPVTLSSPGLTYMKEFQVWGDTEFEFVYELITFTGTFTASVNGGIVVSAEDGTNAFELSNSHTYNDLKYASRVTFLITAKEGKAIDYVEVNGVAYPIKNMSSYLYVCDSVKENLDVRIGCVNAVGTTPTDGGYEMILNTTGKHVMASVKYGAANNFLTVLAEEGYTLSGVAVHGTIGGQEKQLTILPSADEIAFTDTTGSGVTADDFSYISEEARFASYRKYNVAFVLTIKSTELFTDVAEVDFSTIENECTITTVAAANGSIEAPPTASYGEKITVIVSPINYYYIESFIINGVTIPFGSENWNRLTYESSVRHYKYGEYSLLVSGDTTIEAVFKRYSYTAKVDSGSVNGVTNISVSEGDFDEEGKVPHGSAVIISMSAKQGYHIKAVYVNGTDVGYVAYGGNDNTNIVDAFTYYGQNGGGVTQNISVRVLYEINRYSFHYTIVNDSANFAGMSGSGNLTSTYSLSAANTYTGIAFGDNFSINVLPSISDGYYFYSMSITYKGYSDTVATTKTRYYTDGDGIISKSGGTIWFNRFWFAGSSALSTGVTADIENITITFKREIYNISFMQETLGGKLEASFTNPSANTVRYVVVYGKPTSSSGGYTTYYYADKDVFSATENKFMILQGSEYVDSGIRLGYRTGNTGAVVFTDGIHEYEMYFEYGLRCVVTVQPSEGYDRETFMVDGEDRMEYVSNNRYTFNFYHSVAINVSYVKQVFDIGITSVIYTDRSGDKKIAETSGLVSNYIGVSFFYKRDEGAAYTERAMDGQSLSLNASFEYNDYVYIVMKSKFNEKGVYLYNLTKTVTGEDGSLVTTIVPLTVDPSAPEFAERVSQDDVEGEVWYGPFRVTKQFDLNAYFEVRTYIVSSSVSYEEAIQNETKNTTGQKNNLSKSSWSVVWGTNAEVAINVDSGYEIDTIDVSFGSTTLELLARNNFENDAGVTFSSENGFTIMTIPAVKSNVGVRINLKRKSYFIKYEINNIEYISTLTTYYNENNGIYPQKTDEWDKVSRVDTRHYDELRVKLEPIDGYEIVSETITIHSLRKEEGGDWVIDTSKSITLPFSVVRGDTKQFTFHPTNSSAQLIVKDNLLVEINVTIKRYRLESRVQRTNAPQDSTPEKNNTTVNLNVYVAPGNYAPIKVNNVDQGPQVMTRDITYNQAVVQHGSLVRYSFTTPEGYMMSDFSANGFSLASLQEAGYVREFVAEKYGAGYTYLISFVVTTTLVTGANGFIKSSANLISVSLSLVPITYDVYVIINNATLSFEMGTGDSPHVSDNKMLTVYTAKNVTHFGSLNITPIAYDGYKIDATNVYVGRTMEASFGDEQYDIRARRTFTFSDATLPTADATTGNTTVYFIFFASIIEYNFKLSSAVYYSENDTYRNLTLTSYNAAHTSEPAGEVKYSIDGNINNRSETAEGGETVEYFATVTVEGRVLSGSFAIYAVYEKINGVWTRVLDNVNNVSLITTQGGGYIFSYQVDGIGDREFRVDFKQKATITVNIPNPYKYVYGVNTNPYVSYTNVIAYQSDVEKETGTEVTPIDAFNGSEYVFNVYVGNYFSIQYLDEKRGVGQNKGINFTAYTVDLSEIVKDYVGGISAFNKDNFERTYEGMKKSYEATGIQYGGDENGRRYRILSTTKVYLYDNDVYGRVTGSKVTHDAVNDSGSGVVSIGGNIYYNTNSAESTGNVLAEDTLGKTNKEGHLFTIVCEPKDHYAFYSIGFRQINRARSAETGYVVFKTMTEEFNTLLYTDVADFGRIRQFNDNNSSGYVLVDYKKVGEKYHLTLWMNGDVEFQVSYYRTYTVTYARYLPDEIALGGSPDSSMIVAEDKSDVVYTIGDVGPFARSSLSSSADVVSVQISYGAKFSLNALQPHVDTSCSKKYENGIEYTVYNEGENRYTIVIDFCECNSLSMLLQTGGNTSNLTKYADSATMSNTFISSFDNLSSAFASLMSNFAPSTDSEQQWKLTEQSASYGAFNTYYELARALFDSSNSTVSKNISYDRTTGAVIGIDRRFTISNTTRNLNYTDLIAEVARLFGYDNVTTFTTYAKSLATLYQTNAAGASDQNRLVYDGAVYTENGFVMPFAFKGNLANTVLAYLFVDTAGHISIWVSDVNAMYNAVNFDNRRYTNAEHLDVSGRCVLFEETEDNYVFVGWYVNDVNLHDSLDMHTPYIAYEDRPYYRDFIVDLLNMPSLIVNGSEVTEIVIHARFEPIIDVRLVNEKFYAYDYHFNSWDMGMIQTDYYNYSRDVNRGVPLTTTSASVRDKDGSTLTSALAATESMEYSELWSTLRTSDTVGNYSSDQKNNNIVYTSTKTFSVLLENLVNKEYVRNTWTTSEIALYMKLYNADVMFDTWQYFNWHDEEWVTINYRYLSNDFWVDANSSEYMFSLSALYATTTDEYGNLQYAMPYAISAGNKNNMGGDRPLLIRPDLYKYFTVDLQQFAFSATDEDGKRYASGLNYADEKELEVSYNDFSLYPSMSVKTNSNDNYTSRNKVFDNPWLGTFEYGTALYLYNNTVKPGEEVYDEYKNIRYRFIGWHIGFYEGNKENMYYLNGSTLDSSYTYQLICEPKKSDTTLTLKSFYVAQYKQSYSSYSVSGGLDSIDGINSHSGQAAPQAYLTTNSTSGRINQRSVAVNANGAIVYNKESSSWVADTSETDHYDYYQICRVEEGHEVVSTGGASFTSAAAPVWEFAYYVDAGVEYQLHVKKNTVLSSTYNIQRASTNAYNTEYDNVYNSFNPEFDTLYELKEEEQVVQSFKDYYNTGKGTYYITDVGAVTPSYLTSQALNLASKGWYVTNEGVNGTNSVKGYTVNTPHTVELRYVSTAVLIFYNMMYYSGVTILNSEYREALTGNTGALTVWDTDTKYGDWVDNGTRPTYMSQANGEVVIRVTLVNVGGNGYLTKIKYALNGMKKGQGFDAKGEIIDSSGDSLFSPSKQGYCRWLEFDLNNYYEAGKTDIDNTRIFGASSFVSNVTAHSGARTSTADQVGIHDQTPDCYNVENCGAGTYSFPYQVYFTTTLDDTYTNNKELKYVDLFWEKNGQSCKNDDGNQTYFKAIVNSVSKIINLQGIDTSRVANDNPQGDLAGIWQPLCLDSTLATGFDGVFDFDNAKVFGLAVSRAAFTGTCYGLFGNVCGGTVKQLNFINGYYNNGDVSNVKYLGLVCGFASDAEFSGINFISGANSYNGAYLGNAQIYLAGANFVGALFGYGRNCTCTNIHLGADYMEVTGSQYCGVAIGAIEGGSVDIVVDGSSWVVSGVNTRAQGAAGGLIGFAGGVIGLEGVVERELKVTGLHAFGTYPTIIVGRDNAYIAGGLIGIIGEGAVVSNIHINTLSAVNDIAFPGYDAVNASNATGKMLLYASPRSYSSSAMKSMDYGFTGGIAGANYGTINGITKDSKGNLIDQSSVSSFVFAHSGTAGGLVGANFGTVQGFTLGSDFRLYAWEPKDTLYSFNYGGLVGYNYGGSDAKKFYVKDGSAKYTDQNTVFSALINDCQYTGASGSEGYTGTTGWNTASVYVFTKKNESDTAYNGSTKFITTPTAVLDRSGDYSTISNSNNYEKSQNYLRMGGICGYSSARIYNVVAKNIRLSTYRWRYSYDTSPSGLDKAYAWLVQAGIICGYFDPYSSEIEGFLYRKYMTVDSAGFDPLDVATDGIATVLNNNRIQSCLVDTCSININGNVWMDDVWNANGNADGGDDISLAGGISCAGIAGGTSSNASGRFAVNTCKVVNMRFYVHMQAYGRENTGGGNGSDYGWKYWSATKKVWDWMPPGYNSHTYHYAVCLRSFCLIEANVNNIVSGLRGSYLGNADNGGGTYCYYNDGYKSYVAAASMSLQTQQNLGETTKWMTLVGDESILDIPTPWLRYIRYMGSVVKGNFDSSVTSIFSNINIASISAVLVGSNNYNTDTWVTEGYHNGFLNANVVRTDPTTGCLLACFYNDNYFAYLDIADGNRYRVIVQNKDAARPDVDVLT